jgi:hypothetical protein
MNGNLEPEEHVMEDRVMYPGGMLGQLAIALEKMGWENGDDVTVEIGGMSVSGIDVGEEYNKKWQSPIGTRKYNKDAFIIIKNQDRRDLTKSQPNSNLIAHHHKPEVATIEVADQKIEIQQDEEAIRAAIKKSYDEKGYDTYSK